MVDLSVFDDVQSGGDIERVKALAGELERLSEEAASVEDFLKTLNARIREILEGELPEEMAALGLNDFSLSSGFKVEIKEVVAGSLPKDEFAKAKALNLLRDEYDAGGLIRNKIEMNFERGSDNEAKSLAQDLRDQGYSVDISETVHPQSLAAFVRERLGHGEEVDFKSLGIYVAKQAKVKKAAKR